MFDRTVGIMNNLCIVAVEKMSCQVRGIIVIDIRILFS